jgi:hypothetical protein
LNAQVAGQPYLVAGVFNWDEQPLTLALDLNDLQRRAGEAASACICFDFWNQAPFELSESLALSLPPCSCKVLFIHPLAQTPMWIGSDRHVTGAIGLDQLRIQADALEGRCSGPAGSHQQHYFYLPENVAPCAGENAVIEVSQYRVLRVSVTIGESGSTAWRVNLQQGQRLL